MLRLLAVTSGDIHSVQSHQRSPLSLFFYFFYQQGKEKINVREHTLFFVCLVASFDQ